MNNADREGHLAYLQSEACGPVDSFGLHERSLGQALTCAAFGLVLAGLGVWLATLPLVFGPGTANAVKWLLWSFGLGLACAGLAALACAVALWQRHGKQVLAVTPDTLCFANMSAPVPWDAFDSFEIEQKYLSTHLFFSISAHSHAPVLGPACFKGLMSPDAVTMAGGLRVKVWMCTPTVAGRRITLEALAELLYAYLQAAQARRTLAQLFPGVARVGVTVK